METITFKGELTFADEWRLEQGLEAFFATDPDETLVDLDAFTRRGLVLEVDFAEEGHDGHRAPATRKLAALARYAKEECLGYGSIVAENAEPDPTRPRSYRWDLYFAACAGDAPRLRELIARGAATDGRYGWPRYTLLHKASRFDAVDAVEVLIAAGVDVNAATPYGWTALRSARLPITRALLAAGADPNARCNNESVLLASLTQLPEVAEALLAGGAVPDPDEYEALARVGAAVRRVPLLRELVARWPAFRTALASPRAVDGAISGKDPVTLDYLLEQGAVLPEDFLEQALRWAVPEFIEAAMRAPDALAKCGPSNHRKDAMCRAAHSGYRDVMKILAAHGVPLHPAERGDTNPQIEAARAGHGVALAWIREHVPHDNIADAMFNNDRED